MRVAVPSAVPWRPQGPAVPQDRVGDDDSGGGGGGLGEAVVGGDGGGGEVVVPAALAVKAETDQTCSIAVLACQVGASGVFEVTLVTPLP